LVIISPWSSYFKFDGINHAICGAHIMRELEGLRETGQSKWASTFKMFLMSVYLMPFEERVKRRQHIEARYSPICQIGEKAEPLPEKEVIPKSVFSQHQHHQTTFAQDFQLVPLFLLKTQRNLFHQPTDDRKIRQHTSWAG